MTTPYTNYSEGDVVTFPSFERKHGSPLGFKVCRRIGIVRWIKPESESVTLYSPENGRTYSIDAREDIRVLPNITVDPASIL